MAATRLKQNLSNQNLHLVLRKLESETLGICSATTSSKRIESSSKWTFLALCLGQGWGT